MSATALTTPQQALIETKTLLNKSRAKIESCLDDPKMADKMISFVVAALENDSKLALCTPVSVFQATREACLHDLHIGRGSLADSYIVPFGDQATLIVGYGGMRKLAGGLAGK